MTTRNVRRGALERRRERNATLLTLPMYIFTIVFVLGPLIYMLILSFLTRDEVWGVKYIFTLDNYKNIFNPIYSGTFIQSMKLALISTAAVIIIGYPYGYFMARAGARAQKLLMTLQMMPFWVNSLVRLYGWIIIFRANGLLDMLLMALHITDEPLRLLYTYPIVVVGMIYVLLPFMIFSVYNSVEKMDWSLVDAARDLGASRARAFITVTFRLSVPGLLTGVILTFIPSMGLFFIADILGGNKIVLVGNLIHEQLMTVHNWPFAAALAVVLMILTSVIIWLYRRAARVERLEDDISGEAGK